MTASRGVLSAMPLENPVSIYLDTNAWDYLITRSPTESSLSRRAWDARASRRLTFVGSAAHIEELARMSKGDPSGYRQRIRLFYQLSGAFILLPTNELTQAEVKVRGRVSDPDCYMPYRTILLARGLAENQAKAEQLGDAIYDRVVSSREQARMLREKAKEKLEGEAIDIVRGTRAWWKKAELQIADWLQDYMRSSKELLGLSDDESTWPDPMGLPTPRRIHAYLMARIAMTVGENRKIADGDMHDAHHYAAAGYSEVFVTDDGPMRATIATIPAEANDPKLLSFEEFARLL